MLRTVPRCIRPAVLPAALSAALLLGACASQGPAPVADLAVARTSLAQAESAGASQFAPVELLSARDKLSRAEVAMNDKRFNDARVLSNEATADADVAERKARAVKATKTAADLQRANAVLGTELNRVPAQ